VVEDSPNGQLVVQLGVSTKAYGHLRTVIGAKWSCILKVTGAAIQPQVPAGRSLACRLRQVSGWGNPVAGGFHDSDVCVAPALRGGPPLSPDVPHDMPDAARLLDIELRLDDDLDLVELLRMGRRTGHQQGSSQ
jgi:hypothetical protein